MQFLRIVGGLEIGLVGRLQAALHRQGAPVAAGPAVAVVEACGVGVGGARYAEGLADDDGAPGHAGLIERRQGPRAVPDGRGLLRRRADQEARAVHQMDDRQVEGLRHVDETVDLER